MEQKKYTKRLLLYAGQTTRQVQDPTSASQSAFSNGQTLQMMKKMVLDFRERQDSNLLVLNLRMVFLFSQMLPLSCKFSSLTPQTLHMDVFCLWQGKNATMCSFKRTFLTGISRGIVKHSGNLCGSVGISASQTGEIHLESLAN